MTTLEFQAFAREVTDRLARLETKLDNLITTSKNELATCQQTNSLRFEMIERDLTDIKEERKWLWRLLITTGVVTVGNIVLSVVTRG